MIIFQCCVYLYSAKVLKYTCKNKMYCYLFVTFKASEINYISYHICKNISTHNFQRKFTKDVPTQRSKRRRSGSKGKQTSDSIDEAAIEYMKTVLTTSEKLIGIFSEVVQSLNQVAASGNQIAAALENKSSPEE